MQRSRKRRQAAISRAMPSAAEDAVTAVIGTIIILAITIMGIGVVMLWGAPTIDRIQAQNAQLGVLGEMEDVQASILELSVPDHSRFPSITVGRGDLGLGAGTRFMLTANHDTSNPTCDFRVTAWADR